MRLSKLIGQRIKETPKDAQSPSHIFLVRGGYVRSVSSGIYTILPIGKRIINKIEKIVHEEMQSIEGQEVLMPVVNPAEIWEESGRYQGVDETLLKFNDRNGKKMVLAMTHEEAMCHLARTEITSYKQLPCMLYHVQTKYRDEARPRAGLIRVREFTMKDGYSFHESPECLADYYKEVHKAYERFFDRLGMNNVLSIEADTGMIGGSVSHEFMAIAECGEDTIFANPDRTYLANREVATTGIKFVKEDAKELEKVHTPEKKTIEEVASFLGVQESQTGKAVFYGSNDYEKVIFVIIRGDIDVNETKLKNFLKTNSLYPAHEDQIKEVGSVPGYASPVGIDYDNVELIIDPSAAESSNLVVGANEEDYHYINFNYERDLGSDKGTILDIATTKAGDPCPVTGEPLEELRGIEVGNIFQLGKKYSESMNVTYLSQNGKAEIPEMGCYGIGIGRSMAAVVEQSHDDYGPIWPISIAPWHVHIVTLNSNKEEVKTPADTLYNGLQENGIEVVYDDRNAKAGFAFNDADLMGVPFRVVISPKTIKEGKAEFKTRDGSFHEMIDLDKIQETVIAKVKEALAK